MVNKRKLIKALYELKERTTWLRDRSDRTEFSWVNWRTAYGCQIAVSWCGLAACFRVYFDFPEKEHINRDAALAELFAKFAPEGLKPREVWGHGWTSWNHDFVAEGVVSIHQIYQIAKKHGCTSIIYNQESISARWVFDSLGIPLVPGESGKEWIKGKFHPYATEAGKCI